MSETPRQILGRTIREAREALRLTPEQVAHICEGSCCVEYINALERADVKFPAPHALYALSGALHFPYSKLMELAGHVRPRPLTGELHAMEYKPTAPDAQKGEVTK